MSKNPHANHTAKPPRRLPPYANELLARLHDPANFKRWYGTSADGRSPTIWIGIGPGAWQWAKMHHAKRLLTICPPGESPELCTWNFLRGHDPVFVVSCGAVADHDVRSLVAALMRDGVQRVLHGGESRVTRYVAKGCDRGAA